MPERAIAFAAFWRRLSTYIASSACAMSASAAVVPSSGQLAVPRLRPTGISRPGSPLKLIAQAGDDARRNPPTKGRAAAR